MDYVEYATVQGDAHRAMNLLKSKRTTSRRVTSGKTKVKTRGLFDPSATKGHEEP